MDSSEDKLVVHSNNYIKRKNLQQLTLNYNGMCIYRERGEREGELENSADR